MSSRIRVLGWSGALALVLAAPAAAEVEEWSVHAGSFNATKNPSVVEAGFELRFDTRWPEADFVTGAGVAEDGNFWVYAGTRYSFELDERWQFSLGLAVGVYEQGDGKDLGGPAQFRSSYEFSYKTGERSRLGLTFYHLSNAGIYALNPGSNSIALTWSTRRK